MNCKRAQKWASLRRDGMLSAKRAKLLEEHLAKCESCRQAEARWETIAGELRAYFGGKSVSSERAWEAIRQQIRSSVISHEQIGGEAVSTFAWFVRVGVAFAIALLLVGAGWWFYERVREKTYVVVESVETGLPGASTIVYQNPHLGCAIVWVVEPNGKEASHAGT